MYDSKPRPTEGKPIEEVLPSAIEATATSEEIQKASRTGSEESEMKVMYAGSPVLTIPKLSGGLIVAALAVAALIVLVVVLI